MINGRSVFDHAEEMSGHISMMHDVAAAHAMLSKESVEDAVASLDALDEIIGASSHLIAAQRENVRAYKYGLLKRPEVSSERFRSSSGEMLLASAAVSRFGDKIGLNADLLDKSVMRCMSILSEDAGKFRDGASFISYARSVSEKLKDLSVSIRKIPTRIARFAIECGDDVTDTWFETAKETIASASSFFSRIDRMMIEKLLSLGNGGKFATRASALTDVAAKVVDKVQSELREKLRASLQKASGLYQSALDDKLIAAAESGNLPEVDSLFEMGADVNAKNALALTVAERNGHHGVATFLKYAGAYRVPERDDPTMASLDDDGFQAALNFEMLSRAKIGCERDVRRLVEAGADPSFGGELAIREASRYGFTEVEKFLRKVAQNRAANAGCAFETKGDSFC